MPDYCSKCILKIYLGRSIFLIVRMQMLAVMKEKLPIIYLVSRFRVASLRFDIIVVKHNPSSFRHIQAQGKMVE
jgi:hypothetical protein